MILHQLHIEGFRSFRQVQTLDVKALPAGLYHVAGRNEVEPTLEANGAGKSSLFEAVYWALYGKTSRNVRADNVRAWDYKGPCRVTLQTDMGEIVRFRSAKELALLRDHEVINQHTLDSHIRLSSDAFLHSLYLAQFSPYFIDLAPTARMQIYAEIMALQFWEECAVKATATRKEFDAVVIELEHRKARIEGSLETLSDESFEASIAQWNTEHRARVKELEAAANEVREELERARIEVKTAEEQVRVVTQMAKEKASAARKLKVTVERLRELVEKRSTEQRVEEKQLEAKQKELAEFKRIGGVCTHCGQEVPKAFRAKHVRSLKLAIDMQGVALEGLREATQKARTKLEQVEDEFDKNEPPNVPQFVGMRDNALRLYDSVQSKLRAAVATVERTKAERNPWLAKREQHKQRRTKLRHSMVEVRGQIKEARWYVDGLNFWTDGFKDVRYFLIQESLAQLNAEVNESLVQLGLRDWHIQFELEKETKSGTVKRGFLCSIMSPHTDRPVAWEEWSGGESQRLRVASQLGVSNLLTLRSGIHANFEFWDEPSSWLSDAGIKDLLSVLEERAERYQRRIFIADHRALDYPFTGTVQVTKTDNGSTIDIL